jgi:hypothetical protein
MIHLNVRLFSDPILFFLKILHLSLPDSYVSILADCMAGVAVDTGNGRYSATRATLPLLFYCEPLYLAQ